MLRKILLILATFSVVASPSLAGKNLKRHPISNKDSTVTEVSSLTQLNTCLSTRTTGTCLQVSTITDTFTATPTNPSSRNAINMQNSFQLTWECAPGAEYIINNGVGTQTDTDDWDGVRFTIPEALVSTADAKPHTLTIKNCNIIEYYDGAEGGSLGTVELLKIDGSSNAGETDAAALIILDNSQVRGHSVGSSSVGFTFNPLGSAGGQAINNSWIEAGIGADFKGDCGSCVTGTPFQFYNSTLRANGGGVCDNASDNTGGLCTIDANCPSGTCTLTTFPRALKHDGDGAITVSDSTILGQVSFSGANPKAGHAQSFTNVLFEGPGIQTSGQGAVIKIDDDVHVIVKNGRVGTDWPVSNNAELIYMTEGSITADLTFDDCDANFWKSGGTTAGQFIINGVADAGVVELVEITARGPRGCKPLNLIQGSFLFEIENDNVDGFVDGGPELGRYDFRSGEPIPPPGCETRITCLGVPLNNAADEFLQFDDCTTPAVEGDAEGAWQVANVPFATKICGFAVLIDEAPGAGNTWEFTLLAGGTGALSATDSTCYINNSTNPYCQAGIGVAAAQDFLMLKIDESSTPDCTGCEADVYLWLTETYE